MSRYVIAPERSHVWIDARSNVHPIHSTTDGLEGYVDLDLSGEGGVDLSALTSGQLTLSVDRLKSGNRMEDRELAKRIDARRFPTITGVLGTIEKSDEVGTYKVAGDITFRGVTCPHEDLMNISSVDDQTIQLGGQSRFDIRKFGMEPPRMLMLKVEPEVDIRVEIFAVRESGA
ncbi:MAG TPA: YceI family protein [Acidimicrobiales bacterium]|nr:YceI family protein [Acidimicrobiales bacterium]